MIRRVYKYYLEIEDSQGIIMPVGAQLLSVQNVGDRLVLWARVDPTARIVKRRFTIVGTGHDATDVGDYVGTVVTHNGALVWHVFDEGEW